MWAPFLDEWISVSEIKKNKGLDQSQDSDRIGIVCRIKHQITRFLNKRLNKY